jgi:pimeloyl-ACP methyl ester carboxylesterase
MSRMLARPGNSIDVTRPREQMRAWYPEMDGHIERDGVRVVYEVYGAGEQTVLMMPTWEIVHSRLWRAQIPYLARHSRVVCFDPRGNGRSDRPRDPSAYDQAEFADDAVAVLDAVSADRAVVVSLSLGAQRTLILGDRHPDRVEGAVFICPAVPLGRAPEHRGAAAFDAELDVHEGWGKYNRGYWQRDWPGFLEFFFSEMFSEPHSTKQIEDCVAWGLDTTPEVLAAEGEAARPGRQVLEDWCRAVACPVLVLHGSHDLISPATRGQRIAERTRGQYVELEGAGHIPLARDPVRVNLLIRDFALQFRAIAANAEPREPADTSPQSPLSQIPSVAGSGLRARKVKP